MHNDEDGFTRVSKKQLSTKDSKRKGARSKSPTSRNRKLNRNSFRESTSESEDDHLEQLTDQQLEKIVKFYEMKATKFMQTNYFQNFSELFSELMGRDDRNSETSAKKCSKDAKSTVGSTRDAKRIVKSTKDAKKVFDQVICYGLGRFNKQTICRKQLYFLICLRKLVRCTRWEIYDPVFSSDEESILTRLNFVMIERNERCRRSITECDRVKRTLFYMPHCHKFMFNNLFWSNWTIESLSELYLIGNSLDFITNESMQKNDHKSFAYLHNIIKLNIVRERKIENCYPNKFIFNDLSIHTLHTSHLKQSDLDQFYCDQYPTYQEE